MRRIYTQLAQLLMGGLLTATTHAEIHSIEPPNWWVGMHHSQLQLLVHGDEIATYELHTDTEQVSVARIERTNNPNYLFVTLDIAQDALPQTVALHFSAADKPTLHYAYPQRARSVTIYRIH